MTLPDRCSIAVVGAGPAGCFVVLELLKKLPGAAIDLYDKRPAPYGLVAYGVSPDHCRTRRILRVLDGALTDRRVTFHPDTRVGEPPCTVADLLVGHDAVVVCTGMEIPARLPVEGRDTGRIPVVSGLDLAYFFNGQAPLDLPWLSLRHAVIAGNGNVALDAARMLARPAASLRDTDIAPRALRALETSALETVTVIGRRGPLEAKFGPEELREIAESDLWSVAVDARDLEGLAAPDPESPAGLNLETFHAMTERTPVPGRRTIAFRFHTEAAAIPGPGNLVVSGRSGNTDVLPCDLLVEAVGHRGEPLPGLPFDEKTGHVPNREGRADGVPRVYVCGWIKRGAHGLIGHNRKDAIETVSCLLADLGAGEP